MRLSARILFPAAVCWLAGCSTPPPAPLRTPVSALADTNRAGSAVSRPLPRDWWTAFGDPELDRFVALAREQNRELEQAAARIDEARARLWLAGAESALQATGTAGAGRTRTSESIGNPLGPGPRNAFSLGVDFSYEADLWGRVRATREAARQQAGVSEAERAALEISLLGRVAAAQFERLAAAREAALIQRQLAGYADAEQVQRARAEGGFATDLDFQRVRVEQAAREGELAQARLRTRRAAHALAVLCGQPPEAVAAEVDPAPASVPEVPGRLSMELLEARPDVAAARGVWEAARARMEAARAALYPALRLSGSIGFETAHAEDLLDWQSRLWALVGGLTAPLLDGGRLRGQVEIERAQVRRAAAAYEQAVLTAYRDTADSMQALHFLARQREAAEAGRDAAGRALSLSRECHAGGFVSYLEVVDSERAQLAAELSIVRIDAQRQSATVDLIRALGIP